MPPSVAVVHACEAPLPAGLEQALTREVFAVEVVELPLVGSPAAALALAFLDAGAGAGVLDLLVRWRALAGRPCPLLGCAPTGDTADSERALAAGFDDFVAGRASVRELAARLRALARATLRHTAPATRLTAGRIVLDATGHDVRLGTRRVRLTRLECRTLAALIRAAGGTLSRGELLDQVWGEGATETSPRSVDNLVQRLRRKIGAHEIVTVRGTGFRLAGR